MTIETDEDTRPNALIGAALFGAVIVLVGGLALFIGSPKSPNAPELKFREVCHKHGGTYHASVETHYHTITFTGTCEFKE